jgi:hypothetical protein
MILDDTIRDVGGNNVTKAMIVTLLMIIKIHSQWRNQWVE